jgi:hypothetical protein
MSVGSTSAPPAVSTAVTALATETRSYSASQRLAAGGGLTFAGGLHLQQRLRHQSCTSSATARIFYIPVPSSTPTCYNPPTTHLRTPNDPSAHANRWRTQTHQGAQCEGSEVRNSTPLIQSIITDMDKGAIVRSKHQVLQALEQLLLQCKPDDVPELANKVKTMVAQRCRTFNEQQSPLVKLPTELIVAIGEFVLASHENHDKHAFRSMLPILQTCTRLRTALHPLRSKRITCEIKCPPGNRFPLVWHDVMHKTEYLRREGPHKGPITFVISGVFYRTQLSDLVHMAANERSFCGAKQERPSIFVEVPRPAFRQRKGDRF